MKTIERKFSCYIEIGEQENHEFIEKVTFQVPENATQEEIEGIAAFEYCVWAVENNSTQVDLYDRNPSINVIDVLKEARIRNLLNQVIFRDELPIPVKPDFVKNGHGNIVGAKRHEIQRFGDSVAILKQYSRNWSNFDYSIEEVYALEGTQIEIIRDILEKEVTTYDALPATRAKI